MQKHATPGKPFPLNPYPAISTLLTHNVQGGSRWDYAPWFAAHLLRLASSCNAIILAPNYRLMPTASGSAILSDVSSFWNWFRASCYPSSISQTSISFNSSDPIPSHPKYFSLRSNPTCIPPPSFQPRGKTGKSERLEGGAERGGRREHLQFPTYLLPTRSSVKHRIEKERERKSAVS